jgi:hypothetical protein
MDHEVMAAGRQRQARLGIDHHLAGGDSRLWTGWITSAFNRGTAVAADVEQVVGADDGAAHPVGGVPFIRLDQAGAVGVNLLDAVAADQAVAVIEDQLLDIALGPQVDFS